MKSTFANRVLPIGGVLLLALLSCTENPEMPTLYDPAVGDGPTPTIASMAPAGQAFAGIDTVTITGTNFSTVASENIVYFNSTKATIYSSTATSILIMAPNLVLDSIQVRVARYKTERMSNGVTYKLGNAYTEDPKLTTGEEAWSAATDSAGNIYASMTSSGVGIGVKKFPADGSARLNYAVTAGVTKLTGMKMGPLGELYGGRNLTVIVKIPAGGGASANWLTGGGLGKVFDLDFDSNLNIWAGGDNANVYRIRPDKNVKAFALNANVRSVRVYGGYVYFAAKMRSDNTEKVVRFRIVTTDSLDVMEEYFNFSTSPLYATGQSVYAITFSSDGYMYLGTDAPNPIVVVRPDRSAFQLYPSVLSPAHHLFAWGTGASLYGLRGAAASGVVSTSTAIMKINTLKQSAPYYGRQ